MAFPAGMNKYTLPKDNKNDRKKVGGSFRSPAFNKNARLDEGRTIFADKAFKRLQIGLTESSHDNFLCKQSQTETAIDSIRLIHITYKRVLVLDKQ